MKVQKLTRNIVQNFFKEKQIDSQEWHCCNLEFKSIQGIGRHVHTHHQVDIHKREQEELHKLEEMNLYKQNVQKLKQRRAKKGSSDPIRINCQCQQTNRSKVILFYKYVDIPDPLQFALDHQRYCTTLTGKVRIASEGLNVTLAGLNEDIDAYINWLIYTEPFADCLNSLESSQLARYQFFKPSAGCRHVFSDLSIRLVDEICPLGQNNIQLNNLKDTSQQHGKLSPEDFHHKLLLSSSNDILLIDTRNYYESKIGHFEGAIQPSIRKFSQFPEFVERNIESMKGKTIMTYCTGGVRCEKATAFMRQKLPNEQIYMLDGGIHNYLEWWEKKEQKEEDNNKKSLWLGKNYVFDARQSLHHGSSTLIISTCQKCNKTPWDKYEKCASVGCHLLVLCCDDCYNSHCEGKIYCCSACKNGLSRHDLCICEKERRKKELTEMI
ncbi:Rhodanese-like domain-containing protein [Cokeromyces recurvatus]|uniref:Rhodanese-like domain-containing protein n=1 Tax=Cokeromyces recurvatus TaxID=90255 RepID=UPI00221FC28B|nr:Rhodanese-like domain-containing protein [Cokeromyces recurvatus]KAI7906464.1 Rhodanese-like domain-containing protein [Cokeromyces recurvatus]